MSTNEESQIKANERIIIQNFIQLPEIWLTQQICCTVSTQFAAPCHIFVFLENINYLFHTPTRTFQMLQDPFSDIKCKKLFPYNIFKDSTYFRSLETKI